MSNSRQHGLRWRHVRGRAHGRSRQRPGQRLIAAARRARPVRGFYARSRRVLALQHGWRRHSPHPQRICTAARVHSSSRAAVEPRLSARRSGWEAARSFRSQHRHVDRQAAEKDRGRSQAASPDRHSGRRGLSLRRVDAVFVARAKTFHRCPDVAGQWTPRRGPRERSSVGGAARDFWGDGWSEGAYPGGARGNGNRGTRVRGGAATGGSRPKRSGAAPRRNAPRRSSSGRGSKVPRADKAFGAPAVGDCDHHIASPDRRRGVVDRQYKPTRDRRL